MDIGMTLATDLSLQNLSLSMIYVYGPMLLPLSSMSALAFARLALLFLSRS